MGYDQTIFIPLYMHNRIEQLSKYLTKGGARFLTFGVAGYRYTGEETRMICVVME